MTQMKVYLGETFKIEFQTKVKIFIFADDQHINLQQQQNVMMKLVTHPFPFQKYFGFTFIT